MTKALFLDRDGVINKRLVDAYVLRPEQFEIIPGILPIMRLAHNRGYLLIVISNQQGVGKGLMSLADLDDVNTYMQQQLRHADAPTIDEFYVCTDLDGMNSTHRKPAPGMILDAMRDHDIDASCSWFIGDSITDAEAGRAASVRTALIGEFDTEAAELVAETHEDLYGRIANVL
ncbi:MAG: HAD family hydrolase [Ignavibacteria bacterium]|nr:HAD family hydrolase [Ignavibacteria bacterium]